MFQPKLLFHFMNQQNKSNITMITNQNTPWGYPLASGIGTMLIGCITVPTSSWEIPWYFTSATPKKPRQACQASLYLNAQIERGFDEELERGWHMLCFLCTSMDKSYDVKVHPQQLASTFPVGHVGVWYITGCKGGMTKSTRHTA